MLMVFSPEGGTREEEIHQNRERALEQAKPFLDSLRAKFGSRFDYQFDQDQSEKMKGMTDEDLTPAVLAEITAAITTLFRYPLYTSEDQRDKMLRHVVKSFVGAGGENSNFFTLEEDLINEDGRMNEDIYRHMSQQEGFADKPFFAYDASNLDIQLSGDNHIGIRSSGGWGKQTESGNFFVTVPPTHFKPQRVYGRDAKYEEWVESVLVPLAEAGIPIWEADTMRHYLENKES